jgi:signal transduction histidine kinase
LVDLGIAVAVGAAVQVAITVATEPNSRPAEGIGHLLGGAMVLPLLFHRRWPAGALYATSVVLFIYYAANFPGFPPTVVLLVPLYFAVEAGRLWVSLPPLVIFFGSGVAVGLRRGEGLLTVLNGFLPHLVLIVVAILLALVLRGRRELAVQTQERLRLAAEERDREAARRVAQERLRIARELHDTVSHALATVAVQSGTALHVLESRPDQAGEALVAIRATVRAALEEMRATLGLLREGDEGATATDHSAGLDRLPALLTAVRAAGLRVNVQTTGEPVPLSSDVDHSAYRILQESLTNVLRHAGSEAAATIHMRYSPDGLAIDILDDGSGSGSVIGNGSGHGLSGMRERAAAIGGTVEAGPGQGGGFAVHARLPRQEVT